MNVKTGTRLDPMITLRRDVRLVAQRVGSIMPTDNSDRVITSDIRKALRRVLRQVLYFNDRRFWSNVRIRHGGPLGYPGIGKRAIRECRNGIEDLMEVLGARDVTVADAECAMSVTLQSLVCLSRAFKVGEVATRGGGFVEEVTRYHYGAVLSPLTRLVEKYWEPSLKRAERKKSNSA